MRDPYLYEDVNVLVNLAGIKDRELLRTAEADITNIAMTGSNDKPASSFRKGSTIGENRRKSHGID